MGESIITKTRLILFLNILFALSSCIGNDLNGDYSGESEDLSLEENVLVFADYSFDHETYEFRFILNEELKEEYNIPSEHIINDSKKSLYKESGIWEIKYEESIPYLILQSDSGFTYRDKLGLLFSDRRLLLYNEKNQLYFMNFDGLRIREVLPWISSTSSSSTLIEGKTNYSSDNLEAHINDVSRPWVEGVDGYGVSEWFSIKIRSRLGPVSYFLVSNGYVSYEKPYLYLKNSRVKSIRITNEDLTVDFAVELKDSPIFQRIDLPKNYELLGDTFKFEILDVYQGTEWDDTCINLIIPMGELP